MRDKNKKIRAFGTTNGNDVNVGVLVCMGILLDDVQANPVRRADDEDDFSLLLPFLRVFLRLLSLFIEVQVTADKEDHPSNRQRKGDENSETEGNVCCEDGGDG
jgi:hypothetical protein